jgi:hypothetical protein
MLYFKSLNFYQSKVISKLEPINLRVKIISGKKRYVKKFV